MLAQRTTQAIPAQSDTEDGPEDDGPDVAGPADV